MAVVVADLISEINNKADSKLIEIVGVIDDNHANQVSNVSKVVEYDVRQLSSEDIGALQNVKLINCIAGNLEVRAKKFHQYKSAGFEFLTVIHPIVNISKTAIIGEGVIINAFVNVGQFSAVADNVFIDNYGCIGENCEVGFGSVISPKAIVCGSGKIGESAYMGANSVLLPNSLLGDRSKLSSTSVLKGCAPSDSIGHGNPAKFSRILNIR